MIPVTHESVKIVGGNASHDLSLGVATNLSAAIDTLGYRECIIAVYAGTCSATGTVDITVTECDTSGGTYAAITGAVFTQITAANDVAQPYAGRISLRGRKRYFKVSTIVGTDVAEVATLVILMDPIEAPTTPSQTLSFNLDPA